MTTEHFTLQGARSSTISESAGRASVFLQAVSGGLVALGYARRISQLRDYYFDHAPETAGYLPNAAERLPSPGLGIGLWQQFVTVAGMVAVVTAALTGLMRYQNSAWIRGTVSGGAAADQPDRYGDEQH